MAFCRYCGREMHETASACPQCGAVQQSETPRGASASSDSAWMAIVGMILGIVCVVSLFDDSRWDRDTVMGLGLFAVTGLTLGCISISKQRRGKRMSIAGIVLSSLALLAFIGMSSKQ